MVSGGICSCNNPLIDAMAQTYIEALPIIANVVKTDSGCWTNADISSQIGCELILNTLQLVAQLGAAIVPGVGQAVDAGMSEYQPAKQTYLR